MTRDTYEREDRPDACTIWGHRYQKTNSQIERWVTEEEGSVGGGVYGDDYSSGNEVLRYDIKIYHKAEKVTYKCSLCGDVVTRVENETTE